MATSKIWEYFNRLSTTTPIEKKKISEQSCVLFSVDVKCSIPCESQCIPARGEFAILQISCILQKTPRKNDWLNNLLLNLLKAINSLGHFCYIGLLWSINCISNMVWSCILSLYNWKHYQKRDISRRNYEFILNFVTQNDKIKIWIMLK